MRSEVGGDLAGVRQMSDIGRTTDRRNLFPLFGTTARLLKPNEQLARGYRHGYRITRPQGRDDADI